LPPQLKTGRVLSPDRRQLSIAPSTGYLSQLFFRQASVVSFFLN
jgi:hypothetical protein